MKKADRPARRKPERLSATVCPADGQAGRDTLTREKRAGIFLNLLLYSVALAAGLIAFARFEELFLAEAALTLTATLVIFAVTCFVPDTSLYDPYWSVAPVAMLLAAMVRYRLWSPNAVLMFLCVCVWAVRLTGNWAVTYKGIGHEDWRYRAYRERFGKAGFFLINLVGLQMVPTIVVYFGLIGAFFVLESSGFSPWILPGLAVMLAATVLEFISDRAVHRFLRENPGTCRTCDVSVWKYSRHPNYLGEMSFWFGIFLAFVGVRPDIWYMGLGFLPIHILFLTASIPMMEKHNAERRSDYAEYQSRTSVLFLLPQHSDGGAE